MFGSPYVDAVTALLTVVPAASEGPTAEELARTMPPGWITMVCGQCPASVPMKRISVARAANIQPE